MAYISQDCLVDVAWSSRLQMTPKYTPEGPEIENGVFIKGGHFACLLKSSSTSINTSHSKHSSHHSLIRQMLIT